MDDAGPIRISIGSEKNQWLPTQVLMSSIRRRAARTDIEFTFSWHPSYGWHPLFKNAPKLGRGTAFSGWRWMVPDLYDNTGNAIYMDADIVVLADIEELWDELQTNMLFAAVTDADPDGMWGKHTLKKSGKKFKGKVQTSVMMMNCRKCEWDWRRVFKDVETRRSSYAELMQADWLPRDFIQTLDPGWNHFSIKKPETRLVHFSHVRSQVWRDPNPERQATEIWTRELHLSLEAGHVTKEDVNSEIDKGHVHPFFRQ